MENFSLDLFMTNLEEDDEGKVIKPPHIFFQTIQVGVSVPIQRKLQVSCMNTSLSP